ncbi:MAG: Bug family tripartite tricarboxylate transporter substrate binding protein [Burkholderiales bacterium]
MAKRILFINSLLASLLFCASSVTRAQTYPNKPVRMVVPSPAGGGSDILGRLVAQKVSVALGQNVIVDNRVGGDGIIGTEHVARAAADGYTLLIGNATVQVANLFLRKNLPYNAAKDFVAITGGVEAVTGIVVNSALPIYSIADLIDYAKKNPGKFTYGSSGAGGAYHISGEAFKSTAGIDLTHVPYKGLAPSMTAVVAGEIGGAVMSITVAAPQARAGKARILAIIEDRRYPKMPDIPTLRETLPEFRGSTIWNGFFAPAGTPAAIIARLHNEIAKAVSAEETLAKLDAAVVIGGTPEQFAAYVNTQVEVFGRIAKVLGIVPQ